MTHTDDPEQTGKYIDDVIKQDYVPPMTPYVKYKMLMDVASVLNKKPMVASMLPNIHTGRQPNLFTMALATAPVNKNKPLSLIAYYYIHQEQKQKKS